MTPSRGALPALFLFLLLAPAVSGATTVERLASLGRAWGVVKHAHPYLGSTGDAATRVMTPCTATGPTTPLESQTVVIINVLIGERTQSAAEHFGLGMEAAAGSTFVGSSTSGANGNVTDLAVPGGHFITFTGMDVRHGDGRQLQRVGIVPHVPVPRTVANIAAGVDEVLEKALELARQP
jgi:C-terminal processing protease CtpA/Prc